MNFFMTIQAKKVKKYLFFLALAFVTAWFLYVQYGPGNPVFSTKSGPKAIYKGERNVALTFNIGWGDEKAPAILQTLKNNNVRNATFFLSGSWAERHPHILEQIIDQGYEVGMLGYNYLDYSQAESEEITRDIMKAKEAFRKLGITDINYLRAPTGHFDKRLLNISEKFGFTIVHWSIDSKDWTNPGVARIVKNIDETKQGDILLFHASDSAKQTAKALPEILSSIRDKGLKIVTVSEMLSNSSVKTEEVK
ncbi:polysaccharide deacetylase family sporulation protein PdaB [Bacillus sp. 1P06AnD]|uniref:polysaccharide deacetylase family sporulation protein PdaB n=1 Tax=Bacillus sp. 1P06AnD TaxID=3132208 RepID=UPI0039A0E6BC